MRRLHECACVCVCVCVHVRACVYSSYLGGESEPQGPGVDDHTCQCGLEDGPQEAVQAKHQGVALQPQRPGNLEAEGVRPLSELSETERTEITFVCFTTSA